MAKLEYPATCCLYWPASYVTSNWDSDTHVISIPTNFPTKRLELVIDDSGIPELNVNMLASWHPSSATEIVVTVKRVDTSMTNRNTRIRSGNYAVSNPYNSNSQSFKSFLRWDGGGYWNSYSIQLNYSDRFFTMTGTSFSVPANWPATVEEWMEMQ